MGPVAQKSGGVSRGGGLAVNQPGDRPSVASAIPSLNSNTTIEHTMDSVVLVGSVVSVRGAVVDVRFEGDRLPPINTALMVQWNRPERLVLEVHSHVDPVTIRAIALQEMGLIGPDLERIEFKKVLPQEEIALLPIDTHIADQNAYAFSPALVHLGDLYPQ